MKNDAHVRAIFLLYPQAQELYKDKRGNIWTSRDTAEKQSSDGSVTVLKRSEFLTKKKDIENDSSNNN